MRLGRLFILVLFFVVIFVSDIYADKILLSRQDRIRELSFSVVARKNAESELKTSMSTYNQDSREERIYKQRCLSSVGILSGAIKGPLDSQDDYRAVALMVNFGFDLRPLASKIGIKTKGILEFGVEPFFGYVRDPDKDIETGINFLVKYGFPLHRRFMPYIRLGAGPMYLGLNTKEQAKAFNFIDSAGVGFSWFLKDSLSLDCEYRFRHISNSDIDKPNRGIDMDSVYAGFTYRFD